MTCIKCFKSIDPGERFTRTKKGPHHLNCADPTAYVLRGVCQPEIPEWNVMKLVNGGGESVALFWKKNHAEEYMRWKAQRR